MVQPRDIDAALGDYIASVEHAERAGDKSALAQATVLRGSVRYYRGEHALALADMQSAYKVYVALGNRKQQRFALNEIANLYADVGVGEYAKAIEYYQQILASNQADGNQAGVATAHFNIASTLERKGDASAALEHYSTALDLATQQSDTDSVAATQRAMAAALVKLNRAPEALRLLDQSFAYYQAQNNADRSAHVRLTRGTALARLQRATAAMADLDAALAYYTADDNPRFLERIHSERAGVLAQMGRWSEAFAARGLEVQARDRLTSALREEQSSRLRMQFDTERRDQENRSLLRENDLRGKALDSAERVRELQTLLIVLAALLASLFALLLVKVRAKNRLLHNTNLALAASREEVLRSGQRADLIFRALTEGMSGSVLDDKYRIEARVGAGGFGTVYRAESLAQNSVVAIKVFKPVPGPEAARALDRFRSEGISAYRVQHRHAVRVHDFAVSMDTVAYLVMEFLEGISLSDYLRAHGPLSPARAVEILCPLADALACAHAAGVVHRDVKPSNVLLCVENAGEVVKLIDFGIAKIISGEVPSELQSLTGTGFFAGTPSYMAPERFLDGSYDGRSHVYSLGILAFEMLTGARPFLETSESFMSVALQHMNASPPDLAPRLPLAPRRLVKVVMECLEKNPADRPTAAQLVTALTFLKSLLPDSLAPGANISAASADDVTSCDGLLVPQIDADQRTEADSMGPG